jgi:glutamate N-acetyltransferase/amino-acid N-acetyltransferase
LKLKFTGAASDDDAQKLTDTVAHSNLVKTAFFGEDANWGRIIGALGRAGVPLNPDAIDISFNDIMLVQRRSLVRCRRRSRSHKGHEAFRSLK